MYKLDKFSKAIPVYPLALRSQKNISLFFVLDFEGNEKKELALTGISDYQVFLNGRFIHYGPARSAYAYSRIDRLALNQGDLLRRNRLVIKLSGYNCLTYTRMFEPPFFQAELLNEKGETLYFTGRDFTCYRDTTRRQKVVRFAYQREFSEAYVLTEKDNAFLLPDKEIPFPKLKAEETELKGYLRRNVNYPCLDLVSFSFIERGEFSYDQNLPAYDDRYMHAPFLKTFENDEWEIDVNGFISRLRYEKGAKEETRPLSQGEFMTYEIPAVKTGFLALRLKALTKSKVHLAFEEIDLADGKGEIIELNYFRNTTHNIVTYELEEGEYSLLAFEPYTAKYARLIVEEGEVADISVGLYLFENPDMARATLKCADKKLEDIFRAAINTFGQNATDILMDCPSRERSGWLCDTYFSARAEAYITGQNLVERNFLENYSQYVNRGDQPLYIIPMCYPADFGDRGYIPTWSMFYILEIALYYERWGDEMVLNEAKPMIDMFLKWADRFVNGEGLIEDMEGNIFIEWSEAGSIQSTKGVSVAANALYARTLIKYGEAYKRPDMIARGEKMLEELRRIGFDGTWFHDNLIRNEKGELVLNDRISETTQYYVFHFGVADKGRYPALYERMKNELGPERDLKTTWPSIFPSNMFIGDYMRLLVLLENGEYAKAKNDIVAYFGEMARKTGTIWEFDSTYASLTHCFASYALNMIVEILTGIKDIRRAPLEIIKSDYEPLDIPFELTLPLPNGKTLKLSNK